MLFLHHCQIFLKGFFNLILFAAIMPVSEPEKKALKISRLIKDRNKNNKEKVLIPLTNYKLNMSLQGRQ
jgi:hypothetical protein